MQSSVWFATVGDAERCLLEESDPLPASADIAIIGGGMIGLATAYYLCEAGATGICVIERDTLVGEASGANAGGLWFGQQSREIGPLSPLAQASSRLYEELAAQPGWTFDFRRTGLLELLFDRESLAGADARARAVRKTGFRAEVAGREDLRKLEPSVGDAPEGAILYPDEGQLHPVKLGATFARHLRNHNVRFLLRTEVSEVGDTVVRTSNGDLRADIIVIASGAWTPLLTCTLGYRPPIKPIRGQLLATPPRTPFLRHTIIGRRFYYWQLTEGHVAGGGTVEDVGFERGVSAQDLTCIREEMNTLFPDLCASPTALSWSGFRPYCEDLRPIIGRVPGCEQIYVAAGHFKKGIMLAPVTGKVLADLITTGKTDLPIMSLDPARFAAGGRA
jgi:glycine oxidase